MWEDTPQIKSITTSPPLTTDHHHAPDEAVRRVYHNMHISYICMYNISPRHYTLQYVAIFIYMIYTIHSFCFFLLRYIKHGTGRTVRCGSSASLFFLYTLQQIYVSVCSSCYSRTGRHPPHPVSALLQPANDIRVAGDRHPVRLSPIYSRDEVRAREVRMHACVD